MKLDPACFDHAVLGPERTDDEVVSEGARAAALGVRGVCVLPRAIDAARRGIGGGPTLAVAVVNFPAGGSTPTIALEEGIRAAEAGAGEIDVVVPSAWLRAGERSRALEYLASLVARAGVPAKAIVEAGFFDDPELARIAREVVFPSGASFFKTGTGVYGGVFPPERIRALRRGLPEGLRLKVSGGIREALMAAEALESGADVLGTSRTFAILADESLS